MMFSAVSYLALGFALSTIGLVNPSYQACYLLVAGFFVCALTVDVNLTENHKVWCPAFCLKVAALFVIARPLI